MILRSYASREGLVSGKVLFIENIDMGCDLCGSHIHHDWLPAEYVGEYEDQWGMHYCFNPLFWVICPDCKTDIGTIKVYKGLAVSKEAVQDGSG